MTSHKADDVKLNTKQRHFKGDTAQLCCKLESFELPAQIWYQRFSHPKLRKRVPTL